MNLNNKTNYKKTFLYFITVSSFVLFGWILSYKPKNISDITVQLSLFAMDKGYQGTIRMNSGERTYMTFDYLKKILSSPKNLEAVTLDALPVINLELKFEEQSLLRNEINNALSYKSSNEREKLNLNGIIRTSINETTNVRINLKGNGLDHIQYRDKESIRIEVENNNTFSGLSEFSLQHPLVRDFQLEPIFMYIAENYNIMTTHLELVKLNINGNDKGIFLLEEVGTKENIERQGRKNSVVVRFKAPRYPALIGGTVAASGRTETYRTALIDSLNTSKIHSDPILQVYEQKSKGMIRSYLDGTSNASEVFNSELLGSYIAISEVLGAIHPLIFHNFLFYYNPETELLEPIAYDGSLHQRYNHSSLLNTITEGFVEELLYDEKIFKSYTSTIYDLSNKLINDKNFINNLKNIDEEWYEHLVKEYWLLERINFDDFKKRANHMIEKNLKSLSTKSNRDKSNHKVVNPVCDEQDPLQRSINQLDQNINEYNLINAEYYELDECTVIKIWSTAFDYPKDQNFPSGNFCADNPKFDECKYKNIYISGLEIGSSGNSEFYKLNKSIPIEYSAMYNFGFPELPKYQVIIIPIKDITYIKIFYEDLIKKSIVFNYADKITLFK